MKLSEAGAVAVDRRMAAGHGGARAGNRIWGVPAGIWFVAPAMVIIGVFFLLPIAASLALSLTDFDIYALADLNNLRVVWLENYLQLVQSQLFWTALINTLYFVGVGGPLSVAASLGAALLLESKLTRFKTLWRTIFFAPVVTTLVAAAVVWRYLYHTNYGLINYALGWVGVGPIDWMGDARWSMPAIILLAVWKNFGYNMVIFMAGLQSIPAELYEAAEVDGAGAVSRFRHVTLPMLAPTFLFVGVTTMIGYFQFFAEPYVMTRGGPEDSTYSVVMLMYEQGFRWWRLGVASAIAFVLFGITLAATLVQIRLQKAVGDVKRTLKSLALHAVIAGIAVMVIAPVVWMVGASLMPRKSAQAYPPPLWPSAPTMENYRELFSRLHMGRYLFNSVAVSLAITASAVLFNSMAGYAFAKLRFRGRDRLLKLLLGALVVPLQVGMLPLFLLLKQMGLINTYWAVIIPSMATIYGIFLVRQYALSIPDSLLDAARVDGAGELRIYFSIVLPVIRPVLGALAIFTFLAAWNDFMWPLVVLTGSESYTLPVALGVLSGEHVQDAELMMAGSVVTMFPVVALFVLMQKQLIGGIMLGGVKG